MLRCNKYFINNIFYRDMDALCEADEGVAGTAQFLSCLLKILTHCDLSVQILAYGGDLQTALNVIDEVNHLSI